MGRPDSKLPRKPAASMEYVEAHTHQALESCEDGNLDAGRVALEKALALAPGNATVLVNRGAVWLLKGELARAVEDFSHAVEILSGLDTRP